MFNKDKDTITCHLYAQCGWYVLIHPAMIYVSYKYDEKKIDRADYLYPTRVWNREANTMITFLQETPGDGAKRMIVNP